MEEVMPYMEVIQNINIKRDRKRLANQKYSAKMKELHKDDEPIECSECYGKFYPTNKSHHIRTDKHKNALKIREEIINALKN